MTPLLLGCLLTFTLWAAEPSKPATFEVRLVLGSASHDSEELTCTNLGTAPGQKIAEKLHVQKKALLDGSALKSVAVQRNGATRTPELAITFTEPGAIQFAKVTRQHVGERLAIVIDGQVYSAPVIRSEIPGGKAVITGSFSGKEAAELASRLSKALKK